MKQPAHKNISAYIAAFPAEVQLILENIRSLIIEVAPEAEETISYQMPTFKLYGHYLVYFAAFKKHIGLYPMPDGIVEFKEELKQYQSGKGSVQFSLNQPIPYDLIRKIVLFRAQENRRKAKKK
ncbi:MAG: hypothetical protein RLZZ156_1247 [Deinococcota bacterium]|jgi:uncharacterized protein YdhG (YjbR/CyaY superfamily)